MKKDTSYNFVLKAKKKHNDYYDYSLVEYSGIHNKVKIICPKHGVFEQAPSKHLNGSGCKICSGKLLTTNIFIDKANKIHDNYYDYSLVDYKNNKVKVKIICPIHGTFEQLPADHLIGKGCPGCNGKHLNYIDIINKINIIHNQKYDYSLINYSGIKDKVKIICPIHGMFEQTLDAHLRGQGCPKCANKTVDTKFFIEKAKKIHKTKYDYSLVDYFDSKTKIKIVCPEHGIFKQSPDKHLQGQGCPKCANIGPSKSEVEINCFINSLNLKTETSNRTILNGQELDIFIPSHNLAIEFDGLYFHSEKFRDKNYHLNKTIECENKNIKLIHIFEDEWIFKKDIVKSRLKNILGLTTSKIYGRQTIIKEIDNKLAKQFLNNNHLQGYTNSLIKLGLFYNNELVSVMLFNKPRKGIGGSFDGYELSRFANKMNYNVIGGASKLLKYFINIYKPKEIRSYADRRWSDGSLYETLGFELTHINRPNYWYIINKQIREHRFNFRKEKLQKQGFDTINKTEHEIMLKRGIYRIYDCGTLSYKKFF